MCGIAGIIRFKDQPVDASEIRSLTDVIAHRGPDGEGCWISSSQTVGLGHRRLSILDLSDSGSQPMHYADGGLTVVFNGEIFNFAELREELKQKGYQFRSDSDTEVLLAAYHAWGKACLDRFNGFWAFALWDEQKQELWLARDRFGIKPLYYLMQPGKQLVFGSETIQFNYIRDFQREADAGLVSYTIGNCWGLEGLGKTIFRGIEQVRPGHYLTITTKGEINVRHWWATADHLVSVPDSYDQQVEQFREIFEDAVKLRLRSDVNIASALSGGLDSSSVFAGIHHLVTGQKDLYRLPKEWQRAFVAVFPGTEQDERVYAEAVLAHTGGQAVFVDTNTGNDLPERVISSIRSYDTIYSTPLFILDGVYGAMKKHGITVSMDGHGVDEMMYGYAHNVSHALQIEQSKQYTEYANDIRQTWLNMLQPAERKRQLNALRFSNRLSGFMKRKLNGILPGSSQSQSASNWFNQELLSGINLLEPAAPLSFSGAEADLYRTFHYSTLPTILRNFDRGAMRNSIEIRMPFLDYRLVSYVFSLPMQSKLGGGFTKRILRDSMRGILPESVRTRKLKIGFNAPLESWYEKELKELIRDEVSSQRFRQSDYWNGEVISDFVLDKTKNNSWTTSDCFRFWPVLNAHILLKK
ncbi:asparagine synthase (glutamine-hydrolyzing) [Lacibacter sp.]|uniref:asparagine synthase (glutamine-hydrolyzing) n=1 Tax=Lacibacter sp. TaxID=1915409 RepID=UPI002B4AB1B3|nr:asparagine synthase (glutamine-hydrolyzing) [Lacibacter sp.]HLP36114.1 asparagine synthase (glutamine-hydrolyzing) [Lacibacter sp.]